MSEKKEIGAIGWVDLTVPAASVVRDFYQAVVGWTAEEVDMGGYQDYCMHSPNQGKAVAGICHARGKNAHLPAQWLIYITVADADASAARCVELGGQVLAAPRELGSYGRFCVIQDPAGAVAALIAPPNGL
jgi:predicted enzyme related to lactoylglutathione lyase